jgi:hypothetical protein
VRFVGFAWPNPKAYRVLTAKGTIDVSRPLAFDESAPPACDRSSGFSPHIETEVPAPQQLQQPTVVTLTEQFAPASAGPDPRDLSEPVEEVSLPALSPPTAPPTFPQRELTTPTVQVNQNPLFEADLQPASPAGSQPAAVSLQEPQLQTQIPTAPRRSSRPNKGVPGDVYNPCAYGKYAKGLPKKAHVSFAEPLAFPQ